MIKLDKEFEYLAEIAKFDSSNGYYRIYQNGEKEYVHRIVAGSKSGQLVDHINRDKTDNRACNLRICDKALNNYNRGINNPLGRGIYFDRSGDRYRACISHKNKTLKLGSFKSVEEAKKAYNKKASEIYGEAAYQHKLDKPNFEMVD